jgi:hypothetical protein
MVVEAMMGRKERAISLHPLTPEEALAALLRVTPPPKAKKPARKTRRPGGRKKKRATGA